MYRQTPEQTLALFQANHVANLIWHEYKPGAQDLLQQFGRLNETFKCLVFDNPPTTRAIGIGDVVDASLVIRVSRWMVALNSCCSRSIRSSSPSRILMMITPCFMYSLH